MASPQRSALSPEMRSLLRMSLALTLLALISLPASAQPHLADYLERIPPGELVPGAERLGPVAGDPPAAPAYAARDEEVDDEDEEGDEDEPGELLGYVFMNSDVVDSYGYSAKPIHIAVGLDTEGRIVGTKLIEHSEPIILIGIPEKRMTDFIAKYVGRNVLREAEESAQVDAISGATVTVLVIDESITRAAHRVARSRGLGEAEPTGGQERRRTRRAAQAERALDMEQTGTRDWEQLLEEGSVARLHLTVGEVNAAFERLGGEAAKRPLGGDPEDTVSELYVALVSAPVIGRSLLGEREYALLRERLEPGQHAVLIAGSGSYSWRGSGYVRGGIFDRVRLVQDQNTIRFHDREYKRIGDLAAEGAPDLREIGLFTVPEGARFEATRPWRLELLVQRAVGALDKVFLNFDLPYELPEEYLEPAPEPEPPPPAAETAPAPAAAAEPPRTPLWQRIWRDRAVDIAILSIGIIVLAMIFLFQDWLAKRPRLKDAVRMAFLAFTLLWIGWYANAQLSVVNVLTFTNALATEFRWDFFLMDPLVFILWSTVAVTLLFWGRGPFCGWLCPFGALQEFLSRIAKWLRIPQVPVRFGLHERLWPIKYIIFLALFGLALYSLADAERVAEVEPFKTAIILNFVRDWPFVVYALLLLAAGLFIERFFCRYLCPLGAALAIPGRMRMFEWLKRYKECGNPCQRCRNECPVQSIHPEGQINPNECIYCLHCQVLYHDDHRCPVMIQHRLRHERAAARAPKRTAARETAPSVAPSRDDRHQDGE